MATSVDQLENQITTERNEQIRAIWIFDDTFNKSFKSGINLTLIGESGWAIPVANNPKLSWLAYVYTKPQVDLKWTFTKIQVLMWQWHTSELAKVSKSMGRLPVSSLIVLTDFDVEFVEVNFTVTYDKRGPTVYKTLTTAIAQLEKFTFGFNYSQVPDLKKIFSSSLDAKSEEVKFQLGNTCMWNSVKVVNSLDQEKLVRILIEKALETPQPEMEQCVILRDEVEQTSSFSSLDRSGGVELEVHERKVCDSHF